MGASEDGAGAASGRRSGAILKRALGVTGGMLFVGTAVLIQTWDLFSGSEPPSAYALAPFCVAAGVLMVVLPPMRVAGVAAPIAAGGALTLWALGMAAWPGGNDGGGLGWFFVILPCTAIASLVTLAYGGIGLAGFKARVRFGILPAYAVAIVAPVLIFGISMERTLNPSPERNERPFSKSPDGKYSAQVDEVTLGEFRVVFRAGDGQDITEHIHCQVMYWTWDKAGRFWTYSPERGTSYWQYSGGKFVEAQWRSRSAPALIRPPTGLYPDWYVEEPDASY